MLNLIYISELKIKIIIVSGSWLLSVVPVRSISDTSFLTYYSPIGQVVFCFIGAGTSHAYLLVLAEEYLYVGGQPSASVSGDFSKI